jgi:diguanylate cyclase (GGDEF)-like protein/PAS domain S-box-containing protein
LVHRLVNWLRTSIAVWLTVLVVVAAVVGAGAGVLSIADREDHLRETQTELADLSNFSSGIVGQAETALDHGRPTRSDLVIHRRLGAKAQVSAGRIEALWDDPLAAGIEEPTRELNRVSGAALIRAWQGGRSGVEASLGQIASPADALATRIAAADRELDRQIASINSNDQLLTFALSGAIALALAVLILTVAGMHRRGVRGRALREAAEHGKRRLQSLVRHGSDLITVLSPSGIVLYEAGAVESLLGYEPAELEGRNLKEWLHPEDVEVLAALCNVGEAETPARELRLRHRDGGYRTCEARATSLLGDELWNGIVLNVWDVTERKGLEQRLRHQAFHDGLTSLPNRVLFNERLEHALVRGVRGDSAVSVLLIDLDDFKSVNDGLGHPVGDELLQATARRLDESLRAADTVARLGGDEFAVILDRTASIEDDKEAAWQILAAMAVPFELLDRTFPVSASIGIARAEPGKVSAERLVRDADLAMYAAKSEQKGSFTVYREDMHLVSLGRLQLKADLSTAVEAGDQLKLDYQPVVSLEDGAILGFEALLRWDHPSRGLIGPAEFVPLAEESGAIVEIGRWALRHACCEASRWVAESGRDLFLSVNVSARQLQDESLVDDVEAALATSRLSPRRLVLEITESELMRNVDQAAAVLQAVRELGVRVAVDDFGTGYSSLSQLERLPVDVLKVDRDFIGCDGEDRARLLNAVIEIGDSLQLYTIAEGIETTEQLQELRDLDYALGQGYLFSRPVPGEAVGQLLAASPDPGPLEALDGEGGAASTEPVRETVVAALESARQIRERARERAREVRLSASRELQVGRAQRNR